MPSAACPERNVEIFLAFDIQVGRVARMVRRMFMAKEQPNVVFEYTDEQAVDDGVLVPISEGKVNRVTRAVFDHFTEAMGSSQLTGPVTNITPLFEAIRAILKVPPDEDGWMKLTWRGKELWLLPNEVGGLTLMFPDDY